MRRRLAAGQARVSNSLRAVRVSLALPPESVPWPDGAPVDRLRALHRLLDEDETLLLLFTEAVRADRCDPMLPGPYPAELAYSTLAAPDEPLSRIFCAFPKGRSPAIPVALRFGLVPFGAWACLAATGYFHSRPSPETVILRNTLFGEVHSWEGLPSAVRLLGTLQTTLSSADEIGAPVECTGLVPAFANLLEQAPLAPLVPGWPATRGGRAVWTRPPPFGSCSSL